MKVEIQNASSDPAKTLLQCFERGDNRPFCSIEEDDFSELLTESQLNKLENGHTIFNVDKNLLIEKSKRVYA